MPTNVTAVGTSVTTICTVGFPNPVILKNQGPATAYLDFQNSGASSPVTADQATTGGYPLEPGESLTAPAHESGSTIYTVYGITAEGTAYVSALGS